ncbi:MAG: hypothetical protein ACRDLL_10465, partial [Solirubrobacterales bacterium]
MRRAALATGLATLILALAAPADASALTLLPGGEGFDANVYAESGGLAERAGSQPGAVSFSVNFETDGGGRFTEGDLRDLSFEMPPGLIVLSPGAPLARGECNQLAFSTPRSSPFEESLSGESCPDSTQVGIVTVRSSLGGDEARTFGLFNLVPPPGVLSQLGFSPYGDPIVLVSSLQQANGEYRVILRAKNLMQTLNISGLTVTIWGTPWGILEPKELIFKSSEPPTLKIFQELIRHDKQRGNCLNEKNPAAFFGEPGRVLTIIEDPPTKEPEVTVYDRGTCSSYDPLLEPPRAYLILPTSCEVPLNFGLEVESWAPSEAQPERRQTHGKHSLEGCEGRDFTPKAEAQLSDPRASSPSGYSFDIEADASLVDPACSPAGGETAGCAPVPVRKAVVTLPEGVTINPSVGAGLGACGLLQYEQGETASSPFGAGCPRESKIGDFSVKSPIASEPIEGNVYMATPRDNPFGSLLAIYLVAKSIQRGVLVKVAGELKADPGTGRLTATFDELPQLPISDLHINFREGQRSPLATPTACGPVSTEVDFTPWSDPSLITHRSLPASIGAGFGGGSCPAGLAPFAPRAEGGSLNSQAGAYSPFYLHLTRKVTEQEIISYSAEFPPGLLGKIAGIPYCPEADIEAARSNSGVTERARPSCPAASLIGHTYSGYGVGSVLAYAPGNLYLAGPYRGSSLSVVAIDSALIGPFDLGTVIVRSAVRIDPDTAQASIDATGTDPIPHIIDGIPIHLRDIRVYIDRPAFTLNPTSCEPLTIASNLNGAGQSFGAISDDTLATATSPFQAFDCVSLGFKPRIAMRMAGYSERGDHPSLRVFVRPRAGDANIASSQVTLPRSIFLEQSRIKTICTRAQFAARTCPADSVYGHVRVFTPLLEKPMEGPAILRASSHRLPDLVFVLRGHGMEVDVAGRIDSYKGGIRGTFPMIPDAPVTKFVLSMRAGRHGVLVNAENLCKRRQLATARFIGHANRGWGLH